MTSITISVFNNREWRIYGRRPLYFCPVVSSIYLSSFFLA